MNSDIERGIMRKDLKSILSIYKLPGLLLTLVAIPWINNLLWFHSHTLPFMGMAILFCLPICTPYVAFRLFRLLNTNRPLIASITATKAGTTPTTRGELMFYRRFVPLAFAIYLILLYPLSHLAVASVNLGRPKAVQWSPYTFYRMITFPVSLALPAYGQSLWPPLSAFPPIE